MKLAALMVMAAFGVKAGTLTVCVLDNAGVPPMMRYKAQALASQMLATAGVSIEWRCGRDTDAIVIELSADTPETVHPGALAYALAYQGTRIFIYYDRVRRVAHAAVTPFLLGHVVVHEITHLLQGCDQHSGWGVMKARWNHQDFARMRETPLPFTPEDLLLIHSGLSVRPSNRNVSSPR